MSQLPAPSAAALAHSEKLTSHIRQQIAAAGGWISFARYMELALYAPGLGYYSAGATKFGSGGDFTTAPEMSPLFGQTLALQIAEVLPHTAGNVLEFGAGSGKLALDILRELERRNSLPQRYYILDLSAELRERQWQTFQQHGLHLLPLVEWVDTLPEQFSGLMLGNEVLDAMPAHLVELGEHGWQERGVQDCGNDFAWATRPLSDPALAPICASLGANAPYLTEISLANRAFMRMLAEHLQQGLILLIDYGFGAGEYYHPQRDQGTLMCHYRHHAHSEPFYLPGLQDITVHVDFSAIAQTALDNGLDLHGYTTQAHFLLNAGIGEILQRFDPNDVKSYLPHASAAQKLMNPAEMGELFKVIGLSRALDLSLRGFCSGDRSRML